MYRHNVSYTGGIRCNKNVGGVTKSGEFCGKAMGAVYLDRIHRDPRQRFRRCGDCVGDCVVLLHCGGLLFFRERAGNFQSGPGDDGGLFVFDLYRRHAECQCGGQHEPQLAGQSEGGRRSLAMKSDCCSVYFRSHIW